MDAPVLEASGAPGEKPARRSRKWILWLVLGLVAAVLLLAATITGFFFLLSAGTNEVRAMEPWPSPDARPEDVAAADLGHLGLEMTGKKDGHELYPASIFTDGTAAEYERAGKFAVRVTAMRFASPADAADEFQSIAAWSQSNCGEQTSFYTNETGVLHCGFSDAHERWLWSGNWILDVVAMEGGEVRAVALVDAVRDAVAEHWHRLTPR